FAVVFGAGAACFAVVLGAGAAVFAAVFGAGAAAFVAGAFVGVGVEAFGAAVDLGVCALAATARARIANVRDLMFSSPTSSPEHQAPPALLAHGCRTFSRQPQW